MTGGVVLAGTSPHDILSYCYLHQQKDEQPYLQFLTYL